MSRTVVAFDFDGTITALDGSITGECSPPTPNMAMIARMKEHHAEYDFIVVFSARPECDREYIAEKLKEWGAPYDAMVLNKLRYDLFYEDRAVSPLDPRWAK